MTPIQVYRGEGISLDFEIDEPTPVSEIVRYILCIGASLSSSINSDTFKAIFLKKDPKLLSEMQEILRKVLEVCSRSLPRPEEELVFHAFVGNVIALLPYSYPNVGAQFLIPQKVGSEWRSFQYRIDRKIELTPRWFSTPIPAYGLTSKEGPPLLSFLGTTFPSADGFIATLLSDFTPGFPIGKAPFELGKEKIAEWLKDKEKVRLFGISLGGAIALHFLKSQPAKIESIDVYNAPGLYSWGSWKNSAAKVNIYFQHNDLVGNLGYFPKGDTVSLYRVRSEAEENFLKAHFRVYTGGKEVTILKSSPEFENSRFTTKLFTFFHMIISVPIFLSLLLMYVFYKAIDLFKEGATRLIALRDC